ncbi:hypothetical protein [Streptomyces sp. NBC_00696]|uniref:hypothetical protein n=1 Tax=Streptomyces sp. NBC_00696 TaxID=2903672 RepID=UPI002E3300F5|nr:hypothetical protein [Streptomyces sp. NBC_00696]
MGKAAGGAGCWWDAGRGFAAVLGTIEMLRATLGRDGVTWTDVGEDVALWAAVSVVWATVASLSLRRRARTAGVALTPDALADRQTGQLRALRPSVGWSDRMRTELKASDRIAVTAEKGHEEIWFRSRSGAGANFVQVVGYWGWRARGRSSRERGVSDRSAGARPAPLTRPPPYSPPPYRPEGRCEAMGDVAAT